MSEADELEVLGARLARMLCLAYVKGLTEAVNRLQACSPEYFDTYLNEIHEAVVAEVVASAAAGDSDQVDLANATIISINRVFDLLRKEAA